MYDVLIIGAGPIGLACGIEAKKKGLSHIIIEKGKLVNSIYNYPVNMTFFSTSERLEIGDVPFISHGPKPTRAEALEYYRRVMQHWELDVRLYEGVQKIDGRQGGFTVKTSRGTYEAKYVIISTGFYDLPNMLNVPGEDLPKVTHYYKDPHPYINQNVLVVGGGNSAVDVALECYRRSAKVTMVLVGDTIDEGVKYWVKPDIENRIKEGSITVYKNSRVTAIREHEADIETPGGAVTIENDYVLAMTGYHPDFTFLKETGIMLKEDDVHEPVYDEETFESNVPGIYLAGVVLSGLNTGRWFIENSRYHAVNIMEHISRSGS